MGRRQHRQLVFSFFVTKKYHQKPSIYAVMVLIVKGSLADIISRLTRGIGITNEKLDHILKRIEDAESRSTANQLTNYY